MQDIQDAQGIIAKVGPSGVAQSTHEKAERDAQASVVRKAAVITNVQVPSESKDTDPSAPVPEPLNSKHEYRRQNSGYGSLPNHPKQGVMRKAAGKVWVDTQLSEWPENDFRIFVGNLGKEVTDALLSHAFAKYSSFAKAKVMRSKDGQGKGFGFVSLGSIQEGAQALREMNGYYIGSRPCKVKKAAMEERTLKDKRGKALKRKVNPTKHHPYKHSN